MKREPDWACLDKIAVWIVVPVQYVSDAVAGQKVALLSGKALNDAAIRIECFNTNRTSSGVGVDFDSVSNDNQSPGGQHSFVCGLNRCEAVQP